MQFAGVDVLIGTSPKSWKTKSQQIVVKAGDGQLTVSSEMVSGELVDIAGKNSKNISSFLNAFELVRNSIQPAETEENKRALEGLRTETIKIAAREQEEAAEVDKAMNLSGSNLYATYTIIGLNILVFVLMAINGAGIIEPNGLVHLKWGSTYGPLTLSGDWWRLLTNIFIHFGIIHLAMNMYTFYMAGVYLEPLLGKKKYIVAYLCTGILASLTSLWWHQPAANSAGASGAIFGMYGVFLAFLTTSLIPEKVRKSLLQSIGIFILYNLAYGMKGGVDNSAHIGGLLSGVLIGYLYVMAVKKERQDQPAGWLAPLILLLTAGGTFFYLQQHKSTTEERNKIMSELKSAGYKDNEKFDNAYQQFIEMQDKALAVLSDTTITDEVRDNKLKETSLPEWNKAELLATEMQSYDVSDEMHKKASKILQYIQLRKEEITVIDEIITKKAGISKLNELRGKIDTVVKDLQ